MQQTFKCVDVLLLHAALLGVNVGFAHPLLLCSVFLQALAWLAQLHRQDLHTIHVARHIRYFDCTARVLQVDVAPQYGLVADTSVYSNNTLGGKSDKQASGQTAGQTNGPQQETNGSGMDGPRGGYVTAVRL